jgi:hypothetical protein
LEVRQVHFPQIEKNCEPPFGDACPYRSACWVASINTDPIKSGLYVERVPHHEIEIMLNEKKGETV